MPAISGRPDGRLSKYIYASGQGGVCRDMRYSANGLTPIDFAEADPKVKNGSYRGFEKLLFTKVKTLPQAMATSTTSITKVSDAASEIGAYGWYGYRVTLSINPTELNSLSFNGSRNTTGGADTYVVYVGSNGETFVARGIWHIAFSGNAHYFIPVSADYSAEVAKFNSAFPNGTVLTIYCIKAAEITASVGGAFLQVDVIGNPANILLTNALKDGWEGSWIPQLVQPYLALTGYLARKCINATLTSSLLSLDNGGAWSVGGNTMPTATSSVQLGGSSTSQNNVYMYIYQAFAKQTEDGVNAPVYGAARGVGNISSLSGHLPEYGALWMESLIGKIPTGVTNLVYAQVVMAYGTFSDGSLLSVAPYNITHDTIVTSANNITSPALKALNYSTNLNQQGFIQYAYTELKHNGTSWGDDGVVSIVDNQSTKVDLNGTAVLVGTAKLKEPLGWIKNKI